MNSIKRNGRTLLIGICIVVAITLVMQGVPALLRMVGVGG